MIHKRLFPMLADRRWCEDVNLEWAAMSTFLMSKVDSGDKSVLLDPFYCLRWIEYLHRQLGVDFSFGGFGEDRSYMWRGSYLKNFYHLGIDFNVPELTPVHCLASGIVIGVEFDKDRDGGWGGKVTVAHDGLPSLVYAHLDPASLELADGDDIAAGEVVGRVGWPDVNGGWFPHLHLQAFDGFPPLDGYGTLEDVANTPNPIVAFGL